MKRYVITLLGLAALILPSSMAVAQTADIKEAPIRFDRVQPVFKRHCTGCHGIERERGDLNLSSIEGVRAGSSSGPVALSGKPDESLLYTLTSHLETPRMPPGKPKIPQRELDLIRDWITDGMLDQLGKTPVTVSADKPSSTLLPQTTALRRDHSRITTINRLTRHTAITAIAINPKDGQIVVSGVQQAVSFPNSGEAPTTAFAFPEGDIFSLKFSRDGECLLAGGGKGAESGKVVAINIASGKILFEAGDESDVVLTCDLSPDRRLIALGGPNRIVKVYRTSNGELVSTLRKHTDWIRAVAFSPDGLLLASSDRFGSLQVWEAETGKPFFQLRGHTGSVNDIAWASDSERLLSGGQDGILRIWDMHRGTMLKQWNAEVGGILSIAWTTSGAIIAGGRNKQVAVFNEAGQRQRHFSMADEIVKIASNATGSHLVAGDASGNLAGWIVETGESFGHFELPVANPTGPVEPTLPARKPRLKSQATPLSPAVDVPISDAERELSEAREALATTEGAVKATEESLAKLKLSSESLRRFIASREAAIKNTSPKPDTRRADAPF